MTNENKKVVKSVKRVKPQVLASVERSLQLRPDPLAQYLDTRWSEEGEKKEAEEGEKKEVGEGEASDDDDEEEEESDDGDDENAVHCDSNDPCEECGGATHYDTCFECDKDYAHLPTNKHYRAKKEVIVIDLC